MRQKLWKIKYYIKRLFIMQWGTFFKTAKEVSRRSGKSTIVSFFDIVIASLRYNAGYNDYIEFEFYLMNHEERKTYLTSAQSMSIARNHNKLSEAEKILDKAEFHNHYGKYVSRQSIDLRQEDKEAFINFVKEYKKVVFKVVDGNSGEGIDLYEYKEDEDFDKLYDTLMKKEQYLIEEYFVQHPKMSELSDTSVNTIRMVTFIDSNQTPHLVVAALKASVDSFKDNIGPGGIYTIVDENGTVTVPFINQQGEHISIHPRTQKDLIGFQIPHFDNLKKQILDVAMILPDVRYIGWDIAVTPEGNIEIIEGNPFTGPFQLPASLSGKKGVLPKLEKLMQI
ncbi:MAG TPA: sugar-transfer associated ATP-grasp domain-containing protein [Erysipelothrix sp.]|nr:sugar-transfer associated ATP-grasp domain-containing protein [Erysipelothrix sp.]